MKKNKLSRAGIASLVLCVLAVAAFFLPLSTGSAMTDLSLKYAFNIVDVVKIIFNPGVYTGEATNGKGSWNLPGWTGGKVEISVDTKNNKVTFTQK